MLKTTIVAAIEKAVTVLPSDVVAALKRAREVEEEERARTQSIRSPVITCGWFIPHLSPYPRCSAVNDPGLRKKSL
jgi:hypothetical protein